VDQNGSIEELLLAHGLRPGRSLGVDRRLPSPEQSSLLPQAVSYRSASLAPQLATQLATIVFWNDDRTPFAMVTEILTGIFGMSETEALCWTLAVHPPGRAQVRRCAPDEATQLAERAMRVARAGGKPLRVSVEVDEDASGRTEKRPWRRFWRRG